MEQRQIGTSGLTASVIGLGCMSIGTDKTKAASIIRAAYDQGVTYFDTADLYDYGVNEEIVGDALKDVRDNVVIASKAGNRFTESKDGWTWDPSRAHIIQAAKDSLHRLKLDYIDLYQLHGGTLDDPIDETIDAFESLKKEGLIREYGISSIRPTVIKEYAARSNAVSNMMQYSLLDRRPEEQAFPVLEQHNVSVMTRGPLAKGLLTTKSLASLAENAELKGYLSYSAEEIRELLEAIRLRLSGDRSMTELAIQFNLAQPVVASVITGASSVDQIINNCEAVSGSPLSEDELTFLQAVTKDTGYDEHRI